MRPTWLKLLPNPTRVQTFGHPASPGSYLDPLSVLLRLILSPAHSPPHPKEVLFTLRQDFFIAGENVVVSNSSGQHSVVTFLF